MDSAKGINLFDSETLDIDELKNKSFEQGDFATSSYSRRSFGEIYRQSGSPMPLPFDSEGFVRSAIQLPRRHFNGMGSFEKLGLDIQLLNDTFFMPATVVSLLAMDKNNQPRLWNGKTYAPKELERKLKDWQIDKENSLYRYMSASKHKGSALQFFNIMYLNEKFIRHVPARHEILFSDLSETEINKEQIKWFKRLDNIEVNLLTSHNPNRGPRTFAMTSAALFPLWAEAEHKGMLLLGYEPGGALFDNPNFDRNSITYLLSLMPLIAKILNRLDI